MPSSNSTERDSGPRSLGSTRISWHRAGESCRKPGARGAATGTSLGIMCGIGGLIGIAPETARPAAERMLARLRHRGPDDEGLEVVGGPEGRAPAVLVH